jgi:hypothetical protein
MKYLILKAMTNSEWDDVSFALVELTPGFCKLMLKAHDEAKRLNKKFAYSFNHLVLSSDNAEWFVDNRDDVGGNTAAEKSDIEVIMEALGGKDFAVIERDVNTETLARPEQVVKYGNVKINDTGVQFVSYGKYTDDEFWTEYIEIENFNP